MRCGFCHNPHLVLEPESSEQIQEDEIIKFLKKREPVLDALTISGGEPLLQKGLFSFLSRVKEETKLLVKLDTNGSFPKRLSQIIDTGLVDYSAMDVKTSPAKYSELAGMKIDFGLIAESANILKSGGVDYELRTTCIPGYAELEDIQAIGKEISGVKNYYLQQYVNSTDLISQDFANLTPYGVEHLESLRHAVLDFSENCSIRGV